MRNYRYILNGHYTVIAPTFKAARERYLRTHGGPVRSFVRRPVYGLALAQ